MTRNIYLTSDKGGQGVTTTALLMARGFEQQGFTVALVDKRDGDLRAAMAAPYTDDTEYKVTDRITWHEYGSPCNADVIIWDNCKPTANEYETYVVVRNCYMSLRRNMNIDADGTILVLEKDRALTSNDVKSVMKKPLSMVIHMDTNISRKVDAGLFTRLPETFTLSDSLPVSR